MPSIGLWVILVPPSFQSIHDYLLYMPYCLHVAFWGRVSKTCFGFLCWVFLCKWAAQQLSPKLRDRKMRVCMCVNTQMHCPGSPLQTELSLGRPGLQSPTAPTPQQYDVMQQPRQCNQSAGATRQPWWQLLASSASQTAGRHWICLLKTLPRQLTV